MSVDVLVGMQWGDEGKGKVIDSILNNYDWVVRMNGGPNAGHSVAYTKVHQVPAGIGNLRAKLVISPGSVVNVSSLVEEVNRLDADGFSVSSRLIVSDRAHLITGKHLIQDGADEDSRKDKQIGTTRKGNGPAYTDKYARKGIRISDRNSELIDWALYLKWEGIQVADTTQMLNEAYRSGDRILLLVAHGTMLDIDHGTYPFVTSSHCTTAGAFTGSGLPPSSLRTGMVWGAVKAYTTRVAPGFMRGELTGSTGDWIRDKGNEFGTTTGRARRIGWIDLGQLKYASRINQPDLLVLTKVDTLCGLDSVGVITSDWNEMNTDVDVTMLPGWDQINVGGKLHPSVQTLIGLVERATDARVAAIGTGPSPADILEVGPLQRIF